MRLDDKARENLEAALRLLPDDEGTRDLLPNACASRAYYAAYLALADAALRSGLPFTSDDYFRHDSFPRLAQQWQLVDADQRDDLEILRDRRIRADYHEDTIDLEEASESVECAERLVGALLGGVS